VSRARWLAGRVDKILPTHYFHVVATLPSELAPLTLRNKEVIYNMLFDAGSRATLELAEEYERLRAKVGFTAVLHTWSQELSLHPHLHMVVTGGGLDATGNKWVSAPNSFLVPVRALSNKLRDKFLALLQEQYHQGKLRLTGAIADLEDEVVFNRLLRKLRRQKWVVYSKSPFDGAEQVYSYLSQYTHRVAIANGRLKGCENGKVTFKARDNANPGKKRLVSLEAVEFIRRFMQHVLPRGFVRIRHYGLMAPKNVNTRLATARRLLLQARGLEPPQPRDAGSDKQTTPKTWREVLLDLTGIDLRACPQCKTGRLIRRPLLKGDVMLCYGFAPVTA
jgi:Putative transposase